MMDGKETAATQDSDGENYELVDELFELARLHHGALFGSDFGAESALAALKDGSPGAALLARKAISEYCREIIYAGIGSELKQDIAKLIESVAELKLSQQRLLDDNLTELLHTLLPHGELRDRYLNDHRDEKLALTEYVARTFLSQAPLRCFVQASTTAIHLGQQMAKRLIPAQSLFYTNSTILPLTILRRGSFFSVYSFCGPIYDAVCGGWLFPVGDCKTATELKELFTRSDGRLTTAFLMPRAVSPVGTYSEREEAAMLCQIVLQHADHVVILVTSDRLHPSPDAITGLCHDQLESWSERKKNVSIVVCGKRSDLSSVVNLFHQEGFSIHWNDMSAPGWRILKAG